MNNSYWQLPLFLPPTDGALAPQVPLTADIHYIVFKNLTQMCVTDLVHFLFKKKKNPLLNEHQALNVKEATSCSARASPTHAKGNRWTGV